MAKVSNINQRRQIRREAEDWIILLDRGEKFTDQDKASLREWMARSPVHIQELKSANRFWQNQELTCLMVPMASSATSSFSITRMSAYAACLLLGAFLIWQTFFIYTSNGLYVTGIGQQQTVELDDGSIVELNTDTQLRVEYNSDHRNIRLLKGEAHFKVAKNREKPFRVYADNNFVEAVGTAFSVKKQGSLVDILVTEGRVGIAAVPSNENSALSDPDNILGIRDIPLGLMEANQSLRLDGTTTSVETVNARVLEIPQIEVLRRVSWREGLLVFNGETLAEVVEEVSRYTTLSIEVTDTDARKLLVGGRFKTSDIKGLLAALETNFDLQAHYRDETHVELSKIN